MAAQPVRVAIDLETTGLQAELDSIIEVGAIKFAGGEVLETFESFVAPHASRSPTASSDSPASGPPTWLAARHSPPSRPPCVPSWAMRRAATALPSTPCSCAG